MPTIYVITATILSRKKYVTTTINRFGGTIQVEHTDNPEQAKDFQILEHAQELIPKIFNPYGHNYSAEELQVTPGKSKPVNQARTQSWLEERVLK